MANDSHHFRAAKDLVGKGFRLHGNIYVGRDERYLPLYEAKMLHQFDHRFSTYEGATGQEMNAGRLPQTSPQQKRDPSFVVQPRYWLREDMVESAIPKYPEPLAAALKIGDRPSIQRVLCLWAAGYHFNHSEEGEGDKLLLAANRFELDRSVDRTFSEPDPDSRAVALGRDFPLDRQDVATIGKQLSKPENIACDLVGRFSPRWFLGWREICRATDERTLIASVVPAAAIGNKFQLILSVLSAVERLCLLGNLDSLVVDYCARQKLGGSSFSYFVIRQLSVMAPVTFRRPSAWSDNLVLSAWLAPQLLELIYTANDLAPLAIDCGFDGPPFLWDDQRRFEIRSELDAAFFHLYLPADHDGQWRPAEVETAKQLETLKTHFPTPRHAVGFILDQFPLVRQKDEKAHGRYRTKERILEIYDAMLAAQRSGEPYQSALNPPPGEGPRAAKA